MKYFSPQFETGEYDYSSMENAKALTNGLKNDGIGLSKSIHNDNDLEGRVSAIAKAFGIDTQYFSDILSRIFHASGVIGPPDGTGILIMYI